MTTNAQEATAWLDASYEVRVIAPYRHDPLWVASWLGRMGRDTPALEYVDTVDGCMYVCLHGVYLKLEVITSIEGDTSYWLSSSSDESHQAASERRFAHDLAKVMSELST